MSIDEIKPDSGVLYFMQGPHDNKEHVVRIGKTTVVNFYRRLVVYNTAYPHRNAKIVALRLFPTGPDAKNEEKKLLKSFTRVHPKGDWIRYDQHVKEYTRQHCIRDDKSIEQFQQCAVQARKERDKQKRSEKT